MAKQLLNGQKIVVVRCEALNISGEFFRANRTFFTYFTAGVGFGASGSHGAIHYTRMEDKLGWNIVKYYAYLRKMTRYNPTQEGKLLPADFVRAVCSGRIGFL